MKTLVLVRNELLDRGLDDMLQLAEVVSVVREHLDLKIKDPAVRRTTLKILRDMLDREEVTAGDVEKDQEGILYVRSWELPPEKAIERIDRDWPLNRPMPNLGEVVWFELTDTGRDEIRRLSTLDQNEQELVQRVIDRRRPDLSDCVQLIGEGKLNWPQRQALRAALLEELTASRTESPTYVRQLEALLDRALVF